MTAHNEYGASFKGERNIVFHQSKYLQQCCISTIHVYLSLLHARRRRLRRRKIPHYIFDFLSYSIIQTSTWTWRTQPQKLFDSMSVCSLYSAVWVFPFDRQHTHAGKEICLCGTCFNMSIEWHQTVYRQWPTSIIFRLVFYWRTK